jgi:hypothetical protein
MKTSIDRLLECPNESLTTVETRYVLGISTATIARLVNKQVLGSNRCYGRGVGGKQRILIPHGSVVRQLVRMAQGDARENLLAEIAQKCPSLMAFVRLEVEKLASEPAPPAAAVPRLRSGGRAPRVIRQPRRAGADEWQLSLF